MIGVEVRDRKLNSGLTADELMKPLRRMVLDLAHKRVNVSKLKDKKAQVEYVKGFSADETPNLSKVGTLRPIEGIQENDFKGKKPVPPRRRTVDPSERKTLAPKGVKLNISNVKIAEIFKELRTIRMEDAPHASAVLLRVFLELSVDHYMDANKIPMQVVDPKGNKREKSLAKKVEETIEHLVAEKHRNRKDFTSVARGLGDSKSPLHTELLHAYVHNRFVTPKNRELRSAWDDAQRFFETIWT